MNKELNNRVLTSIILILLLFFMLKISIVLISSLLLIFVFSWLEFCALIEKIFSKKSFILKYFSKFIIFLYLLFFIKMIINEFISSQPNISISLLFIIMICIFSDIGGYFFGKTFKGKKLTKISPNKTYSGMFGSFILSIFFALGFSYYFNLENLKNYLIISFFVSLVCQLGDLFISYLKRKSEVKDTGNILPGHGGILDRIDGILFAMPFGILLIKYII